METQMGRPTAGRCLRIEGAAAKVHGLSQDRVDGENRPRPGHELFHRGEKPRPCVLEILGFAYGNPISAGGPFSACIPELPGRRVMCRPGAQSLNVRREANAAAVDPETACATPVKLLTQGGEGTCRIPANTAQPANVHPWIVDAGPRLPSRWSFSLGCRCSDFRAKRVLLRSFEADRYRNRALPRKADFSETIRIRRDSSNLRSADTPGWSCRSRWQRFARTAGLSRRRPGRPFAPNLRRTWSPARGARLQQPVPSPSPANP